MIWTKLLIPALLVVAGVLGGIGMQQKLFNPKPVPCPQAAPCPACVCPPAVSVQPFDVQKMKNIREFTYQPEYKGMISIAGVDSTAIKKYISDAIVKAITENVKKVEPAPELPKRKRR